MNQKSIEFKKQEEPQQMNELRDQYLILGIA